jgi:LPXTG-site transpeptidase (sortase) family protein
MTKMTKAGNGRDGVLKWIERTLLAAGVALGGWCAAVLIEARYVDRMQPPLVVTQRLPDDETSAAPAPRAEPGGWLARLEVPSVQLAATVLEGTDTATLNRGAGHIEDTPFPGESGNVGIAGHRDRHFRALRRIHIGDPIRLTTATRTYHYEIRRTLIVKPSDVQVLDPTPKPTLTLVTCYPFEFIGHAPKRFIVQAELVGVE